MMTKPSLLSLNEKVLQPGTFESQPVGGCEVVPLYHVHTSMLPCMCLSLSFSLS